MKKEAYADTTIGAVGSRLRYLARNCILSKPEVVKGFIASKNCSTAFKESLIEAYDLYCRANSIAWSKPFYQRYDKLPRIPSEEKLNIIIANASREFTLILSMMKDLGTRPIELSWLRVRDVDLETGLVNISSAKHCVGRTLKLKTQTLALLKTCISARRLGQNDLLFKVSSSSISEGYRRIRNRLAEKLEDTSFKTIRLYDFRHFRASMEYHKTKDLLYVKQLLGHRDWRTTLRYTQLIDLGNEEFHSATAKTAAEAAELVEQGFDFVCDVDTVKLFRKRK